MRTAIVNTWLSAYLSLHVAALAVDPRQVDPAGLIVFLGGLFAILVALSVAGRRLRLVEHGTFRRLVF